MRFLGNIIDSMDMSLSKLQEIAKDREAWHSSVHWSHKESDITQRMNNNKFSKLPTASRV